MRSPSCGWFYYNTTFDSGQAKKTIICDTFFKERVAMNVYTRIYKTAKKHGMSVKEVAKKAHIGENSIYRWKVIKPSIESLTKVAKVLHVSTDFLLGQDNNKGIDLADTTIPLFYQGHPIPDKYIKMLGFLMEEDIHEKSPKNKH